MGMTETYERKADLGARLQGRSINGAHMMDSSGTREKGSGYGVRVLLSLVAATLAVMVAWVFVMSWRDEDVVTTAVLGFVFVALAIMAISFMLASP